MASSSITVLKYQALGNDYLFLDASKFPQPSQDWIVKICDRHYGIGSDGLLYGKSSAYGDFSVQIFNPDGSVAEMSGNGTRIFAYAVCESGYVPLNAEFSINTGTKSIKAIVRSSREVSVDMGCPSFTDANIPHFNEGSSTISIDGQNFTYYPASIGNPHCVIFHDATTTDVLHFGPQLENNPLFPNKTNVQFAKILDRGNIDIKIWERGAGYTLASGSSACAVFAVAHTLDLCEDNVEIHMPGGALSLQMNSTGHIVQTGPVEHIATCTVTK